MNIVELSEEHVPVIHCPFCGTEVIHVEKVPDIDICPHTLFVATSEGYEFMSERFSDACESHIADGSEALEIEEVIDKIHLPNSLAFLVNPMPPSMLALYIGFAAIESD
jgi:hypothetical protein